MNRKIWIWLVALAALALYWRTLDYDFVYDSQVQVATDDFIHQPRHFADVLSLRVMGMDVLDFNRPLNLFTLMVDSLLWGRNPAGFRLTNLLLHAAAVALLFRWLRLLTGDPRAALLAALFFAVHPLHVETIVEVSNREDLLATVFLLAGMNAAIAFQPGERRKTWGPGLLAFACFFLAAASKETGIAGPVVLAAYWFLFRRTSKSPPWAWGGLLGAVGLAVGTFYVLRFSLEPKHSIIFTEHASAIAPLGIDWLLVQARIWIAEGLRVIWPTSLCADYGPYNLRGIDGTWALLGVFGLAVAASVCSFLNRKIALACVLLGAALLPVSNLVPIYHPMADRYLYLPMAGVALLLAVVLAHFRSRPGRGIAWTGAGTGIALLAAVTLHEQTFWRDAPSLWEETARQNPLSLNAALGRGDTALDRGDPAKALSFYEQANDLAHGGFSSAYGSIALAEDALHQPQKAANALALATKLDSRYARPETLVRGLVYPAYQAQRFYIIALRAKSP